MNVNTNEIVDTSKYDELQLKKLMDDGFIPVPLELQLAAQLKLKGEPSAMVSKTSGGKLSEWAKKIRYNQLKGKGKIK
jgi:hypothetical protein